MYRSVIGYGKVEFVSGFDEKVQALDIIMQQHGAPAKMAFDPKEIEFIVVLKLKIESMTGKQSPNWNKLKLKSR